MNRHVLGSTLTVIAFWWIVLGVIGGAAPDTGWEGLVDSGSQVLTALLLGSAAGVAVSVGWVWCQKRAQRELLRGESIRGLGCSLGELPIIARAPARAPELPGFEDLPDVPPQFYPAWLAQFGTTHPAHVALLVAVLKILNARPELPATDVPGGHGGRTLLQHCLLTGRLISHLAQSWEYTGVRTKKKRLVLALRDPTFTFRRDDPLIVILGVAHDIGKIEAFVFDDEGRVTGIKPEHDMTGARMLARLPEAWALPPGDRQALFLALAHYHHPMELPLSPDRRALDDRTVALMELLIHADFVTGSQEAKGAPLTHEEMDRAQAGDTDPVERAPSDRLWDAFIEALSEHGRVNSKDKRFNMGALCLGEGFDRPMLLLKEDAVRAALIQRLKLSARPPLGDGRHEITLELLRLLDEKGVLHRTHAGVELTAENALWNVDFLARDRSNAAPTKSAGWSAVIVLDPRLIPRVAAMEPYWWWASLQRPTMGSARALQKKKAARTAGSKNGTIWEAGEDTEAESGSLASSTTEHLSPAGAHGGKSGTAPEKAARGAIDLTGDTVTDAGAAKDPRLAERSSSMDASTPSALSPEPAGGPAAIRGREPARSAPAKPLPEPPVWEALAAPHADMQPDALAATRVLLETGSALRASASTLAAMHEQLAAADTPAVVQKPRQDVAPIDVMHALASAVQVARDRQLTLDSLDEERFIAKASALSHLAPEIDWARIAFKLEQLCRSQRLDARFIALREGDYALAFPKAIGTPVAAGPGVSVPTGPAPSETSSA